MREPSLTLFNAFVEIRLPSDFNRIEVNEPEEILPGVFSTGCLEAEFPLQRHRIHEQALYPPVKGKGLVLLVGCSHPKPQELVERALWLSGEEEILFLMGGFHFIAPTREDEKIEVLDALGGLDIQKIAPNHCTGPEGIERIASVFPDRFVKLGLGDSYEVG